MASGWTEQMVEAHNRRLREMRRLERVIGETDRPPEDPKPERGPEREPVQADAPPQGSPRRFRVRITSYRRRLIDPDNLFVKPFIDCLRYAEIIPNDRPQDIELQVGQEKVKTDYTEIEVTKL
jgi:hypothetical protein